jgi:hypothetical protein
MRFLLRHPATQAALAWFGALYLNFALRTTRWVLDGAEHFEAATSGQGTVGAFWHECVAVMPRLWLVLQRRDSSQRAHILVSRHRDGRLIGAVVRRFGMDLIYGSSTRGGAAGVLSALPLLARGEHVIITPDGPRGPRRVAARGVAQVAAMAGTSVLPCAAQTSRRHVLRSWDRMVIPLPFGRGVVVCMPLIAVPREGWDAVLPEIEAALTAAADRADRLCNR